MRSSKVQQKMRIQTNIVYLLVQALAKFHLFQQLLLLVTEPGVLLLVGAL